MKINDFSNIRPVALVRNSKSVEMETILVPNVVIFYKFEILIGSSSLIIDIKKSKARLGLQIFGHSEKTLITQNIFNLKDQKLYMAKNGFIRAKTVRK